MKGKVYGMGLNVLQNEEKQMNMIMFLINIVIGVVAFGYVMLFLGGTPIDAIVFLMPIFSILIKLFEKPLGRYTKYLYVSVMPIMGPIIIVGANDGRYGAITQAYFFVLILAIAYYDKTVVLVNTSVTIGLNMLAMIIFPSSYKLMHNIPIWIFIMMVYALATVAAYVISSRTCALFMEVEKKEEGMAEMIENVKVAFEPLESFFTNIYTALDGVNSLSQQITDSTKNILLGTEAATGEVAGSIEVFNTLADKITASEEKVDATVNQMNLLEENNDIGINSIRELIDKFKENEESTQHVSKEIQNLSEKSADISNIIEVILGIARQTNLLALNAAIEAARAGEAGKGFAVVADEIKQLSEQSTRSTQKIDEILKEIVAIVESADKTMDYNNSIVRESSEKLNTTVDVFKNMIKSSEEVITEIKQLSEELSSMAGMKDDVISSMNSLANTVEGAVDATREIDGFTGEQVSAIENVMNSMDSAHKGMENLSTVLNAKQD